MTRSWLSAVYKAVDAAAAGDDPVEALAHLNETDANRALAAASPFIEQLEWHAARILAEPSKSRRRALLQRVPAALRKPVERRVRRGWAEA